MRAQAAALSLLALAACAGPPLASLPPANEVVARAETQPVGTANADAADDPAIWQNAADPARSLIVGTDKKAGLYVYGPDGAIKSFNAAGQLNNVALAQGADSILVAASDRTDPLHSRIALFALDPADGSLAKLGAVDSGPGEAYGLCMGPLMAKSADGREEAMIYAALKDGTVREVRVSHASGAVAGSIVREWKIATQIEGCVVNSYDRSLFVGEEMVGVWRISLREPKAAPVRFASVDGQQLVADVEGLALATLPDGRRILLASSQGDHAYAAYDTADGTFLGRFRLVDSADGAMDGTSETDGIDVVIGDFGPAFPGGLFVAQDGDNGSGTQNFKLVAWDDIAAALGL